MSTRRKKKGRTLAIKGFLRAQIVDTKTGKVCGDSGWLENQITNYGMANCFVGGPAAAAATVQASAMVIGSGTTPASDATALPNSIANLYFTVAEAINGSTQAQFTGTISHTDQHTIANVGLLATNTGSLLAGETFTQSTLSTTQTLNMTYNINYATS